MQLINKIQKAKSWLNAQGVLAPQAGIILGTGLGNLFVEKISNAISIPYAEIPHFPLATVASHRGQLIYGDIHDKKVLVMQGRFHYYEGYEMDEMVFPIRVMKALGVKYLLISNAAGNLNLNWKTSDLMLIDDHINLQPSNPLRGVNQEELGPRFPDMSSPYDANLNQLLIEIAVANKIKLHRGVYAAVSGPSMETRAECRYIKKAGADAVAMSTVPEVIAANHMGLPCCAVSALTNTNDPDNLTAVGFEEVLQAAKKSEKAFFTLYTELIRKLSE
ncbi:MAG TPA: purine-nucleoside phosphorylase [Cyclobacteriaceae bacterium]|nr:purine-nucleoside phosphorylase [Cyclobacteriaceae bacterium]